MLFQYGMTEGLHRLSLAKSDAAIEEEWFVGLGGRLGDRTAGRMRKAGVVAHHEMLELEFRIELRGLGQHRFLLLVRRFFRHSDGRAAAERLRLPRDHFERHTD